MTTTDQSTTDTIRDFLALPPEALPSVAFVDGMGSKDYHAGAHLRDWLLPDPRRHINHMGETVRLQADRDGWRDGVVVTLN